VIKCFELFEDEKRYYLIIELLNGRKIYEELTLRINLKKKMHPKFLNKLLILL
jgi:hypothetical protein